MCAIDFDEYCSVWIDECRTARTPKTCRVCGMQIQPGDPYLHHRSLFDGEWTTEAACAPCTLVRNDFCDAHGVGLVPSGLFEFLRDCVVDGDEDSVWRNHLAFIMRRQRRAKELNRC